MDDLDHDKRALKLEFESNLRAREDEFTKNLLLRCPNYPIGVRYKSDVIVNNSQDQYTLQKSITSISFINKVILTIRRAHDLHIAPMVGQTNEYTVVFRNSKRILLNSQCNQL